MTKAFDEMATWLIGKKPGHIAEIGVDAVIRWQDEMKNCDGRIDELDRLAREVVDRMFDNRGEYSDLKNAVSVLGAYLEKRSAERSLMIF